MHVVITGASAGIGRALAREYANHNAKLTLVARRLNLLEELAREIGGDPHLVQQDLADSDRAESFLADATDKHGSIDVLVNNAAMQPVDRFDRLPLDQLEQMLHLNLHTPLRLMRAVLPEMIVRRSGTIVNISSAAAVAALPGQSAYCGTKAGLAATSEAVRAELRFTGVHVLTAYPGYISTKLGDDGYDRYAMPGYAKIYRPGDAAVFAKKLRRAAEKKKDRLVYPPMNHLPMWFGNTTRFVLDRLAPQLKEDA